MPQQLPLLSSEVGFCYLSSSNSVIRINFHMILQDNSIISKWVVTVEYDTLTALNSNLSVDGDDRARFPIVDIKSNLLSSRFNMENVIIIEDYRQRIKSWINYCLNNLIMMNERMKSFVSQHLLSSPQHASVLQSMIAIHSIVVDGDKSSLVPSKPDISSSSSILPSKYFTYKWKGSSVAKTVLSSSTTSHRSFTKPTSLAKVFKYPRKGSVLSDASYLRKKDDIMEMADDDTGGPSDSADEGVGKHKVTKSAVVMVSMAVH